MHDYDFSGLSPRSFERLIQAIAVEILGPGVTVYGDGPDGGREATFNGAVPFPSSKDCWNGYGVIQAKFKLRAIASESNGKWLAKQLDAELSAFSLPSTRRMPDYYIVATNVVLSPATAGGKDRIHGVFKRHQKRMGLRAWSIWDFDQLATYLDSSPELRSTYGAWITPGDVLAKIMASTGTRTTSQFLDLMTTFLSKGLVRDQFANLTQAGHVSADRIPLARMFVDLPFSSERRSDPPPEDEDDPAISELVKHMIAAAGERLNPSSQLIAPEQLITPPTSKVERGRYVIVGAPGQGKTTLGQYLCQLFRAALLRDRPSHLLAPEVKFAIGVLEQNRLSENTTLPLARRFPVRIILSELAAAIQSSGPKRLSLLSYIAQAINDTRNGGDKAKDDELREWMTRYPWLIVLDGLDEVPASTNREEVLQAVQDFWIEAAQADADVLVVATTRPQGYSEDFSPGTYRHLWLAPLSPKRALRYARRLAESRWPSDIPRQERVLSRLSQASEQEATARLMRSPLQVTIMTTLVDQAGPPPQYRWQLFRKYYSVIYDREKQRDIPESELLRDLQPDVDAIHHEVGLVLQIESECSGGTEAKMSAARFSEIVTARLLREQHAGAALANLRDRIIGAAANRLVFLVGLEAGQVGFEIRSLQEFMAAEALCGADDKRVQDRLRHIAPLSSWRNVFLFAAGRCFAEDQHRRDTICAICAELNSTSGISVDRTTLSGSALALDLLEDGVARNQPKYARLLADCALRLLDLPPVDLHSRLADVYDDSLSEIYRSELSRSLSRKFDEQGGAWATLMPLIGYGLDWAIELGESNWTLDCCRLLRLETAIRSGAWGIDKLRTNFLKTSPDIASEAYDNFRFGDYDNHNLGSLFSVRNAQIDGRFLDINLPIEDDRFTLQIVRIGDSQLFRNIELPRVEEIDREWLPLVVAAEFDENPSLAALEHCLRKLSKLPCKFPLKLRLTASWVIDCCFSACKSKDDLEHLAGRVAAGELGDLKTWIAAEQRWNTKGLTVDDLRRLKNGNLPFDSHIDKRGIIWPQRQQISHSSGFVDEFFALYLKLISENRIKELFSWGLVVLLSNYSTDHFPGLLTPEILNEALHFWSGTTSLDLVLTLLNRGPEWWPCLDKLGHRSSLQVIWTSDLSIDNLKIGETLASVYSKNRHLSGLLQLMSALALTGHGTSGHIDLTAEKESSDLLIQRAAIIVSIAQGRLNRREVKKFAKVIAGLSSRQLAALADLLTKNRHTKATFVELLLEVFRDLGAGAWEARGRVIGALKALASRKNSGLSDLSEWERLGLPKAVALALPDDKESLPALSGL